MYSASNGTRQNEGKYYTRESNSEGRKKEMKRGLPTLVPTSPTDSRTFAIEKMLSRPSKHVVQFYDSNIRKSRKDVLNVEHQH